MEKLNDSVFEYIENFVFIDSNAVIGIEPQRYSVSNYGRIYDGKKAMILPFSNRDGSPYVLLNTYNGKSYFPVDIIVATYFCSRYDMNTIVRHIDGDTTNCSFINLEWVRCNLDLINKPRGNKITKEDALLICRLLEMRCYTYDQIAKASGIVNKVKHPNQLIGSIKTGRTWREISENFDISNQYPSYKYNF